MVEEQWNREAYDWFVYEVAVCKVLEVFTLPHLHVNFRNKHIHVLESLVYSSDFYGLHVFSRTMFSHLLTIISLVMSSTSLLPCDRGLDLIDRNMCLLM